MSFHVHALTRSRIRRLFATGLAPAAYRSLLHELHRCPSCAALYSRLEHLESALCQPGGGPSPFALERVQAAVLSSTAEQEGEARRWALLPVAVACAAGLGLLLLRTPEATVPELAARSAASARNANVGIRVLRVATTSLEEATTFSLDDLVTFTYTNADKSVHYLTLFGVQEDGQVRWYYPGVGESASRRISSGHVDEALGDGIRLSVNHRTGWLRVTALFSQRPLDRSEVETAVRAAPLPALRNLAPLDVDPDLLEHSLLVTVTSP